MDTTTNPMTTATVKNTQEWKPTKVLARVRARQEGAVVTRECLC